LSKLENEHEIKDLSAARNFQFSELKAAVNESPAETTPLIPGF